jgi:phage tail-like protein
MIAVEQLLTGMRFHVQFTLGGNSEQPMNIDAGFQDIAGLEIEMDVTELIEGGKNDGVVRRPGRAKNIPLVFKRGMFLIGSGDNRNVDSVFWRWIEGILNFELPVKRCAGSIELRTSENKPCGIWKFARGLPVKVKGPDLNAKTGDIAMEELHIVHEGLRFSLPGETS